MKDGSTLGVYQILSRIGGGGMGDVYRARDTRLDRIVAIKVLPENVADEPERLIRFEREAKLLASVNHPNICTIYEIGNRDGQPFIVMELVEGETLDRRLAMRRMEVSEILDIAVQIADALETAHAKEIVHRDIKPANLMITPRGQVKVLDFGLAKLEQPENRDPSEDITLQTQPGAVMGTVRYMSPEQALGREVDHHSDIFSFGVVLYEMATGHAPFAGSNDIDTINQIINAQPEPVGRWNPKVQPRLQDIIARCLNKNREQRYSSARSLLIDLRDARRSSQELLTVSEPHEAEDSLFGRLLCFFGMTSPYRLWEHTQFKLGLLSPLIVLFLGWKVMIWTPGRWGLALFFAGLLCGGTLMILRIVLLTSANHRIDGFTSEINKLAPWIRGISLCLVLVIAAMAFTIAESHTFSAALLGFIGVLNGLAALILEPWVNHAAFPPDPSI